MSDGPGPFDVNWTLIGVVDADAVLQDLRFAVKTGAPGNIGRLAQAGNLLMAPQAVAEVDAGIEKVAGTTVDPEAMRALWATYRRGIVIEEPPELDVSVGLAADLNRRDPKDLPTLALATSRANAVIMSNDTDLIDLGLAPDGWLTTTRHLLPVAQADGSVHGGGVLLSLGATGIWHLGDRALKGSVAAGVLLLVLFAGTAYLLIDSSRRSRLVDGAGRVADAASELAHQRLVGAEALRPYVVASLIDAQVAPPTST